MEQRRILVAVTGGIAAYKIPELIRILRRAGASVRCAMTPEAREFVAPLVLQTLTGHPVRTDLFDASQEGEIDHISLADWAEVVILAPATANTLAKLSCGLADDLVSAVLLATRAPVLAAPAMNVNMWENPATRSNLEKLRQRGIRTVGPEVGELACGWEGAGRMSQPEEIAAEAELLLGSRDLEGEVVLVSAGGTREPIDAVRYLGNRSSGKMGFAVAAEAALRGADVVLVAGPTPLDTPPGVRRIDVLTALEMRDAIFAEFDKNPDILAELCQRKGDRLVIGFAAESHDLMASARRKITRKGCDLLVANNISSEATGFDADDNTVVFVWPGGQIEELPSLPKREVAVQLLDRVAKSRGGDE